ncbi:tRNA (adenosine(37)-N6)-threonylcarbamoyltransferase complex dimerization subunit type 1 TsaB [Prochlorococcus marinus]|uniref:tRNA (adenosine(37)-N6)-threonylcarbamoyltransferase complex dimerization subunit type 1 TsaB n=1 Tax=Prochlorococcus marinus TaxID=1219 RepID=UPI0022B5B565|nr:tRNA (adenosine(37)-N6)-threonylcarbamoyltransferase complex dimerization subunit type 1 TsaB [Prochlorococcus marinus]
MNLREPKAIVNPNAKFILALHSSTENCAIGLIELINSKAIYKSTTFETGRNLSNHLFNCIEELLPRDLWKQIIRLAVAIGPGGFTGTRLTVIMARTLAQQLDCSLDGISSFALMAPRLYKSLNLRNKDKSFWITQPLKHRGIIGGKYQPSKSEEKSKNDQFIELISPSLLSSKLNPKPAISASEDIAIDIITLLNISLNAYNNKRVSKWQNVLPIYPTSPIDNIR